MMSIRTLAVASISALIPAVGFAAPITIDGFTAAQTVSDPDFAPLFPTSSTVDSTYAGGDRTVTAQGDGGAFPGLATVVTIGNGSASISNGSGVIGTGLFSWDLRGFDLTDRGLNDTFILGVNRVDLALSFSLTVDGRTVSSSSTSTTGNLTFGFASFGQLTDVQSISLFVSGPSDFDADFAFLGVDDLLPNVSPVPLPAGGLLLGSVLLGGAVAARRKAKKA